MTCLRPDYEERARDLAHRALDGDYGDDAHRLRLAAVGLVYAVDRTELLHRTLNLCDGYAVSRSWDAHNIALILRCRQLGPPAMEDAVEMLDTYGLIDWRDDRQRTRQYAELTASGAATLARWDQQIAGNAA